MPNERGSKEQIEKTKAVADSPPYYQNFGIISSTKLYINRSPFKAFDNPPRDWSATAVLYHKENQEIECNFGISLWYINIYTRYVILIPTTSNPTHSAQSKIRNTHLPNMKRFFSLSLLLIFFLVLAHDSSEARL